jgi:hypothetical protein
VAVIGASGRHGLAFATPVELILRSGQLAAVPVGVANVPPIALSGSVPYRNLCEALERYHLLYRYDGPRWPDFAEEATKAARQGKPPPIAARSHL